MFLRSYQKKRVHGTSLWSHFSEICISLRIPWDRDRFDELFPTKHVKAAICSIQMQYDVMSCQVSLDGVREAIDANAAIFFHSSRIPPSVKCVEPVIRINDFGQCGTGRQDGMSDCRWLIAATAPLMRSFGIVMLLKLLGDGANLFSRCRTEDL